MDLRSMDNEERLAGQFRRVRCASAFDEEGKYRLLWKSKGEKLIWYISFTGHRLSVVVESVPPCSGHCLLSMPFFSLRQEGARLYIDVDWHRPAEDFLLLVREIVAVTDQIEDVDEALSLVVARLREGMARVCPSEDGGHLPSRVREERFSYANKVVEEAGDRMRAFWLGRGNSVLWRFGGGMVGLERASGEVMTIRRDLSLDGKDAMLEEELPPSLFKAMALDLAVSSDEVEEGAFDAFIKERIARWKTFKDEHKRFIPL